MVELSLFCNACGEPDVSYYINISDNSIHYTSCRDCNSTDISVVENRDPLPEPPEPDFEEDEFIRNG